MSLIICRNHRLDRHFTLESLYCSINIWWAAFMGEMFFFCGFRCRFVTINSMMFDCFILFTAHPKIIHFRLQFFIICVVLFAND